jgi:hypothetical protein
MVAIDNVGSTIIDVSEEPTYCVKAKGSLDIL